MLRKLPVLVLTGMIFLFLVVPNQSSACNRTYVTLDSIVPVAGNFNVHITLCIGGGITGTQKGGDGATRTFAFNFYGAPTLGDQGFFPPSVTGNVTGIVANGANVGSFMGSAYSIAYIDPGSAVPFICVSSTPVCGNEHTQCNQYIFTMTELFDSLRVVGIEGSGNPVAGCYPDGDMLIDLSNSLDVDWTYFHAISEERDVKLSWGIFEFDAGEYEIFRGIDGGNMESAGKVPLDEMMLDYSWKDYNLEPGNYRYQILHTSLNGEISKTEIVTARVMAKNSGIVVAPSLIRDRASLRYFANDNHPRSLKIYNLNGHEVFADKVAGNEGLNEIELDFSSIASGIYLVELRGGNTVEVERVLRQ